MKRFFLLCLVPALFASCGSAPEPAPESVKLGGLADELAKSDVVFFGEEHDNLLGHQQRFLLFKQLHSRRQDMILTMEMFERDVQKVLTQYLVGEIDEKSFLAQSRPWTGYAERYRPFVEYAKGHGIHVVAANAPRPLVRKMRTEGWEAVSSSPWAPRRTTAPKDQYWENFKKAMSGHMGTDEERIYAFYRAQCLWDDTMAESIVDALKAAHAEGRKPLVVHLVGKFHAEDAGGTQTKVLERMPRRSSAS